MAPVVHTPVEGFNGIVVGVSFQDGVGETDDAAALGYFQSAGYNIDDLAVSTVPPAGTPLTPEELARVAANSDPAAGESPPAETPQGQESGEAPSGEPTPPEAPKKPYPQANKAEWFDYLEKVKPGHGLTIENTKADIIAAAGAE